MHDLPYETNNYSFKYIESYSQQPKKKEVHIFLLCASANMWICCRTYPCMPQSEKFMTKKDDWCAHCKKKKKKQRNRDSLQRFFVMNIYVYG